MSIEHIEQDGFMQHAIAKTAHPDAGYAYKKTAMCFLTAAAYMLLGMHAAHAFSLCTVAITAQNSVATGIAYIGVLIVGIGATLGKVSWTVAITVAVGISIMLNIPTILTDMGSAHC